MIDYFSPNQVLILPELSEKLYLTSDKFIVRQKFDGGMGTCYRIEDENGISYAIKVIHSDLLEDAKSVYRYNEELKMWLTFSACEGIAEAVCVININEIPCVVSTWMDCGDMRSIIQCMDPAIFYYNMDRIIASLKWVNDHYSIIHRDLKPGNILIGKDKKAFVADWGLAKLISNVDKRNIGNPDELAGINPFLTQQGSFVGTALYASPEQLLGDPKIDHRSDIYSLGCIMYQWETGRPPFMAKTLQEIASCHLYSKPNKIGGFFKSTHFKAESIIMKCLEKNPNNRYQTYEELLSDLHQKASKVVTNFVPYKIKERYLPVNIGHNDFLKKLNSGSMGVVGQKGLGLVSQEDITPYIKEAISLSALNEHSKAAAIYQKLYIPDMVKKIPDFGYHQLVAINYANELNSLGKKELALDVILSISNAKVKPGTYYVNLSNIYIRLQDNEKCISTCEEGLQLYPNDPDLIGNYTIGLTQVGRLEEAVKSATKRLKIGRDVHSICEAASVEFKYAEKLKNSNFPEAIRLYKEALALFREALTINPRYMTALYNITLILFKMKRYTDSMNFGVQISKIEKGTSEVLAFYAARNMLWTSNFEEALRFCNNWIKAYPNSIFLKRVKSEVLVDGYVIDHYTEDGFPIVEKSSLDFFSEIVKDKVNRLPSDVIYLAKIHCWMNEPEEIDYGIKLLEWGKKIYPQNWKFNFYLAAFALKYKQPDKALQEALECQRKAPWRETAYSMLASVYSANNQEEQASKMRSEYERLKTLKKQLYDSCKSL